MTGRKPRAPREPRTYPYRGSSLKANWFDIWPDDTFVCRCGWTGHVDDLAAEWFSEIIDGSCPKCDTMLLIRPRGSTFPEARRAAKAGHPHAADVVAQFEAMADPAGERLA